MIFRSFITLAAALAISASAYAHSFKVGDLQIGHPYALATMPNQPNGVAYLSIENKGESADKLIALSSPSAQTVALHMMSMEGNVMKMREVQQLAIDPSAKIAMKPGDGYHIMLTGLKQPLKGGDKFPITLTFEKAGKADVSVWVEDKNAKDNTASPTVEEHHH